MIHHRISPPLLRIWIFVIGILAWQESSAALSEPDIVFYGRAVADNQLLLDSDTQYTISARLNGNVLASYVMGSQINENLANHYILRIPMDSVGTRSANRARTGDQLQFFVASASGDELLSTITAGERGQITQLKLGKIDIDHDDVDDEIDNCLNFTNPTQADNDNDGAGDACDDFPNNPHETVDSDSDGMGDNFEQMYGLNPHDPSDAHQDADQDGISNLAEFEAGSNPRDTSIPATVQEDVPLPPWMLALLIAALARLGYSGRRGPQSPSPSTKTK